VHQNVEDKEQVI